MATLNYAFKEISCKIVFYGCGLCGKTTNLQNIHKSVPGKHRGELVSLATEQDRTLFFDFLPLDLGEVKGFKTKFQLYTVPGQVYYNATRKLVLRGVDGLVFVVDSQRDRFQENLDSLENLKQNLAEYNYSLDEIPWVIQYNKRDMPDVMSIEELERTFNKAGVPWVESVAPTGIGVRETLKAISGLVIRNLNRESVMGGSKPASAPNSSPPAPAAPSAEPSPDSAPAKSSGAPAASAPAPRPAVSSPVRPSGAAPSPAPAPPPAAARTSAPAAPPPTPKPKVAVVTVENQGGEEVKAKARKSLGPELDIRQPCDARWRHFKTGSAKLTLTMRPNEDDRGDYQLQGVVSFLGFMKQSWARLLMFKCREMRDYEGAETPFFRLESAPGEEGPVLTIWVKDAYDKQLFIYYAGWGGPIIIVPEGKTSTP